jgi:hypothetical protein
MVHRWPLNADHLVLVIDPQDARLEACRAHVEALTQMKSVPTRGCVVWTKQDLFAKGACRKFTEPILDATPFATWPSFETRVDRPPTLSAPLSFVLEQARG